MKVRILSGSHFFVLLGQNVKFDYQFALLLIKFANVTHKEIGIKAMRNPPSKKLLTKALFFGKI
jgi:hypothetical protein